MNRKTLAAALLCTVLPFAHAERLNYNVIEFAETAGVEIKRDTMTVQMRIFAEGKKREDVSREFVRKYDSVSKRAQQAGFKTELLYRNASPRYEYKNGKDIKNGWEESATLQIESRDFEALNRLIADSTRDASLENMSFSISQQQRQAAVDEVSKTALRRFRQRADVLAAELGKKGYKIVRLNFGHIGHNTTQPAAARMRSAAAAAEVASLAKAADVPTPETTQPGTEEVSITVQGSIQL
ncbi:SIMPL domain-containing protein [Neisseria sp.]|uniref:SIMPL domain-containing protein n=1 Tax=Neisseria sp. TaxID=192066 RepID=UPI0035A183FE